MFLIGIPAGETYICVLGEFNWSLRIWKPAKEWFEWIPCLPFLSRLESNVIKGSLSHEKAQSKCRNYIGSKFLQVMPGKNIVYHFPNTISKNLLRIWLTRNLLVKPLTCVNIPSPDQPPWSFLDTSLLQYQKENLKVNAWINYNISSCEKLGFGLHLILNTGYDLTTALGKF